MATKNFEYFAASHTIEVEDEKMRICAYFSNQIFITGGNPKRAFRVLEITKETAFGKQGHCRELT